MENKTKNPGVRAWSHWTANVEVTAHMHLDSDFRCKMSDRRVAKENTFLHSAEPKTVWMRKRYLFVCVISEFIAHWCSVRLDVHPGKQIRSEPSTIRSIYYYFLFRPANKRINWFVHSLADATTNPKRATTFFIVMECWFLKSSK